MRISHILGNTVYTHRVYKSVHVRSCVSPGFSLSHLPSESSFDGRLKEGGEAFYTPPPTRYFNADYLKSCTRYMQL